MRTSRTSRLSRATLPEARVRLAVVRARIARHPLNAPALVAARELLAEHRDLGKEELTRLLAERGLPGPAVQGRYLLRGLPSLARLHRERLRLEASLAELEARVDQPIST